MTRLLWTLRRRFRGQDLEDEIRTHLEIARRERVERGGSPESAESDVRREFGNIALIQEVTREMWGMNWLERISQDVRYAFRSLKHSPGFAVTAIVSLAFGVGANTATFSIADAFLLRPLPVHQPGELVTVTTSSTDNSYENSSYPDFLEIRKSRSFEHAIAYSLRRIAIARDSDPVPQMKFAQLVSSGFFSNLGIRAAAGRTFTEGETSTAGREPVAVLSYEFWRSHFGSDPKAVGASIRLNGVPFTIVGVAAEEFTGMDLLLRPAFYVPFSMADRLSNQPAGAAMEKRGERVLTIKARLQPSATVRSAQAELDVLGASLSRNFPDTNRGRTFTVRTEVQARAVNSPQLVPLVVMLGVSAALVLIIACANVANLLLIRARARSREIAVRMAIGSGRGRLFQQLITESFILALCGGAAGVAMAHTAIRYLASIRLPTDTPIALDTQLDGRVLLFTLLASVASAFFFGVVPAWRTVKPGLSNTLKSAGSDAGQRTRTIGRSALVSGQVALSLVLLITAGALFDAFRKMLATDPGFRTERVMMMEFDPALVQYSPEQSREFYQRLLDRVRALRQVRSSSISRATPFRPNFTEEAIVPEGFQFHKDQVSVTVSSNVVDEDYFRTMDVRLVRGREFTSADTSASRRVAIVNQEFAERYWPGQEPIGKRFRLGVNGPHIEIVGMVRNSKYLWIGEAPQPYFYMPFAQTPRTRMTLLTHTAMDEASAVTTELLQAVRSLDPNQPVFNVIPMQSYYRGGALGPALIVMQMVSVSGLVGLALAVIGLYSLVAYTVSRRTREIAVRMAIGASRKGVLRLVLRQGLTLALIGTAAGLALGIPVFRLLASALTGLGGLNVWTLVLVPSGLILVTLIACAIPARRASGIDPALALRHE